ncbi:MAG TPA: HepT-like ribonuclease domain-containing protein [Lacipirellulaceae bacterium]|jgi:uncharacterized protein with HEPN domain
MPAKRTLSAGRSRQDLDNDRLFHLAMTRLLEILGEAASRVSEQSRKQHPTIVWNGIVGLRNRLIHGYDDVDCDVLWSILQNDISPLVAQLEEILAHN